MAYVTIYEDIIFIEGEHPRAIKKHNAYTCIGGFGAQLKSLYDIKGIMSNTAKQYSCNCIVNFTYGQKHKLISIDDVLFVGDGYYAVIPDDEYKDIILRFTH